MPIGGFVAPDRGSHLVSLEVGFHSSHRSIRPTLGHCVIAEPVSLRNMVFVIVRTEINKDCEFVTIFLVFLKFLNDNNY